MSTNAPKPAAKRNIFHATILKALLDNRQTTRTEIRSKKNKKTGEWEDRRVDVLVPTLAGNVSEENVNRAARRWIA